MVINDKYHTMLKYCKARPERKLNIFIKPSTPWTYSVSIWANYYDLNHDGENEQNINEIFEHDFNRCQMNNFIKNEEATSSIKRVLKVYYKRM